MDENKLVENQEVLEQVVEVAAEEQAENSQLQEEKAMPTTKAEVIERLKELVAQEGNAARSELDALKQTYYKIHHNEVLAAREEFLNYGGVAEEFIPAPDPEEENFKAQMALLKELRAKAIENLEKEKQQNLERKLAIIEEIKSMAASPEEADKAYEKFRTLQAEWKEIKLVPAEQATELWKNYHLYVELFYDQLRLNHEFRAYDFKKNLENKTHLCEAAEKLADVEDPVSAFHQLQKLHQEFREIGPVAKELREEIWSRFKEASTVNNKRHQAHFEALKAREEENLEKKTALWEKAEALKNSTDWNAPANTLVALQKEWKTIGPVAHKVSDAVWKRFNDACNYFFEKKNEATSGLRKEEEANLEKKNEIFSRLEALLNEGAENAAQAVRITSCLE